MKPVSAAARPLGHGAMPLGRGATPDGARPSPDARDRLCGLAKQLEGVFMTQLFKAMRESVPQHGLGEASSGEQMFTSMLDEKIADQAAARMNDGVSEALVRQLARANQGRVGGDRPGAAPVPPHPAAVKPASLEPRREPMPLAPGLPRESDP